MPTPFSHLVAAQRMLQDDLIPQSCRDLLHESPGAFLLGNIAADARVGAGMPREHTHFYAYGHPIAKSPWRVMMERNPALWKPCDLAHRAFIAGYIAHLGMDEIWTRSMVMPNFAEREWASRGVRYLMLHIILIYMDERDLMHLEPWQADALHTAQPDHWLDFISDDDLRVWQTLIYNQLKPGGVSQTLEIFGGRIERTPAELRAILDSDLEMEAGLWSNIPKTLLAQVEDEMYDYARQSVSEFWANSG